MSEKKVVKPLALAVGVALAGAFAISGTVNADSQSSPFELSNLDAGYMLGEGEGSCGGDKGEDEGEGSCGGDKEGEGSCGDDKEGEGSCGDHKEGEGSCGDHKEGEGSCGDDKEGEGSGGGGKKEDAACS